MTYAELKAILDNAGKQGVHLFGAQSPPKGKHLIRSAGTQSRVVRKHMVIEGKRSFRRYSEPLKKGYSTALIDGVVQTVKV